MKIVGSHRVHVEASYLDELSWDALSEGRLHPLRRPQTALPLCVVEPGTTAEVQKIIRLANEERIPIVPYGGGSGLMGGALSICPNILLDLRGMGIYGSMGDQVLGLEAVMADGEILRTRGVRKSSAGINLNALLIGGEGCFGIITEATVRIFPAPQARLLSGFMFESFAQGYAAVQDMFLRRLRPALLDFGDDAEKHEAGAVLYLGFEGNRDTVEAEASRARSICAQRGGTRLPDGEAEGFFRDRHVIARRFMQNRRQRRERGRDGIYHDWMHVALPASKVLAFRAAAATIIERRSVRLHESGLWVHPELFSMRLGTADHGTNQAQLRLEETIEELLRLAQKMGGSMEYTHGIGVKLASLMAEEHGYGLEVMRRIKQMLDPNGILNPGNGLLPLRFVQTETGNAFLLGADRKVTIHS
ncbi:MAG: FAD-binding oxidoreductase [Deltaproteobacteria bacterium]|nr:FAD-binding oxidoreductase [Deltaproteobacteria bacterium]